jgi:hypothetical protein
LANDIGLGLVLWTTDIEGLSAFLSEAVGLSEVVRHPGYCVLDAGGAHVVLHSDEALRGHPWYNALRKEGVARGIGAEVRLRVRDVSLAFDRAMRMGGLTIMAPYEVDGDFECQVMGPDGYLFTFWEPVVT